MLLFDLFVLCEVCCVLTPQSGRTVKAGAKFAVSPESGVGKWPGNSGRIKELL